MRYVGANKNPNFFKEVDHETQDHGHIPSTYHPEFLFF
jgi:hypothetical protein